MFVFYDWPFPHVYFAKTVAATVFAKYTCVEMASRKMQTY